MSVIHAVIFDFQRVIAENIDKVCRILQFRTNKTKEWPNNPLPHCPDHYRPQDHPKATQKSMKNEGSGNLTANKSSLSK